MIGSKENIREQICDSNKLIFDEYMLDKENISLQDMVNYARSSSSISHGEVVLWGYIAVDALGYDKAYYYEGLKTLVDGYTITHNYPVSLSAKIALVTELEDEAIPCCNPFITEFLQNFFAYLSENGINFKTEILDFLQERINANA